MASKPFRPHWKAAGKKGKKVKTVATAEIPREFSFHFSVVSVSCHMSAYRKSSQDMKSLCLWFLGLTVIL
jgi:hypothetical protein